MRASKFLLVLPLIVSTRAFAYDGFEADFAVCTQGSDQRQVVEACTRLIDNAATENATIGMFYGLRAANNDGRRTVSTLGNLSSLPTTMRSGASPRSP